MFKICLGSTGRALGFVLLGTEGFDLTASPAEAQPERRINAAFVDPAPPHLNSEGVNCFFQCRGRYRCDLIEN